MGQLNLPEAQRALDPAGNPVPGAKCYVYQDDSDVLIRLFEDNYLNQIQPNPISADTEGHFPDCFLLNGSYRVRIETPKGTVLSDTNDVVVTSTPSGNASGSGIDDLNIASGFARLTDLISDNNLSYSPVGGRPQIQAGECVIVWNGGFVYEIAPQTATDADLTTAGGVGLYVQVNNEGCVSDRQFGHISNDADRLNTAIAWAIRQQKAGNGVPCIIVQGEYVMDKPIKAFDFNGTDFRYVSVHIESPAPGYVPGQRTTFTFTGKDNPGIVTQKIRQLTLKNIAIVGTANNLLLASHSDLLERNNWWNVNGAVEEMPYKLYAGICIDPFFSGMAANQKFPHFDGSGSEPDHYTASSGAGSTQILIESCDIQGWVVGVMCAASNVQLGDSITVEKCNLSHNRWPFFLGESQNRGCVMIDCHAKGFDTLMVGGSGFGAGTGTLAYIRGGVFVYGHSIVNGDTARGSGAVADAYFENVWSIGHITGGQGFTFKDSQIKLIDARNANLPDVDAHLTGNGTVNFLGGYIGKYTSAPRRLKFTPKTYMDGVTFDNVPTFRDYSAPNIASMNCRYTSGEVRQTYNIWHMNAAFNNPKHGPGARVVVQDETWLVASGWDAQYLGGGTVTVNGDGTATVTGLSDNVVVGDEISVLDGWIGLNNQGDPDTHSGTGIGYVESISNGTVNLTAVPISFTSGSYSFYIWSMPYIHPVVFGDLTHGSNIITNMTSVTGWRTGQWIKGAGIPKYSRVLSVSGNTITISNSATTTATDVEIYDAKLTLESKFLSSSPVSGVYPAGSFIRNSAPSLDGNNMILTGWICTKGGIPGTWEPVYQSSVSLTA
ncbi:hypothetical protein TRL7639_04523 [Falsiruegeria litorea R37]|uniref:Uncharacterized protein n=2 Tax=Falsiruegeria litorea TaxID=1280831 RepID=A0A1Y5TZF7_9RHOB|nr:hypothetical protein TRL7639_04523 [Falsiruegeria litorea R37]